jgi:pyridoxal phosphate enzyme (YggS family)
VDDVRARLEGVLSRISEAASAAGRAADSVRLLAVSKGQSPAAIEAAYRAGQRDFGENYVQELTRKAVALGHLDGLRWHFIGHLQTNKAKLVAGLVRSVHSVDGLRLALELDKRRAARRDEAPDPLRVLVEVNIGREPQKHGALPEDVGALLEVLERSNALAPVGLMTVPPQTDEPAGARRFFNALAELRDALGGSERLPELSMGMSADLEQAVACGATWVRVGTAIFGPRETAR